LAVSVDDSLPPSNPHHTTPHLISSNVISPHTQPTPPTYSVSDGVFCGTIMRKVICTLIKHKAFGPPGSDPRSQHHVSPLVNWATLECNYPRYPRVEQLSLHGADADSWLDLRPYIDVAAYTISEHASVQRTYRMFRTLGLRHLCVTDRHNVLLGIVTRADLVASKVLLRRSNNASGGASMGSAVGVGVGAGSGAGAAGPRSIEMHELSMGSGVGGLGTPKRADDLESIALGYGGLVGVGVGAGTGAGVGGAPGREPETETEAEGGAQDDTLGIGLQSPPSKRG